MIFVTGNAGYIGSHLSMPGCDLKSETDLASIRGETFDCVIHLAAYVSVPQSMIDPQIYLDNNFFALVRFIERNSLKRFVFASTCAVYGNRHQAKEEDSDWNLCTSPYAQSKFLAEQYIREHISNHCILRLANVYGGNSWIRGEASVHAHFEKDHPISVYGGDQTRDFIHIDKVTNAIKIAAYSNIHGTYNIGSGTEISIRELAQSYGKEIFFYPRRDAVDFISIDPSKSIAAGLL